MKSRLVISLFLVLFIGLIAIQYSYASVMMDCVIKSKVKKVYSDKKVKVKFVRIIYRGGHTQGHNFYDDLVGKTKTVELETYNKELLKGVKEGKYIYINYSEASGPSGDGGFFHSEDFELVEMPEVEKLNQLKLKPKKKGKLYGYANKKGEFVIEAKYTIAKKFNRNGYAYAAINDDWYFINKKGEVIVTPLVVNGRPDPFINNRARFIKDGKMGIYNNCGEIVFYASHDYLFQYHNGNIIFVEDAKITYEGDETIIDGGKWGMLSDNGYLTLNNDYKKVFPLRKDKIKTLNNNNEIEYYNHYGSEAKNAKADNRILTVKEKNGKYGFVNEDGKFVIDPIYTIADEFSYHGVTSVLDNNGWYIINKDGKKLFKPFIFDNGPDYFVNDIARFVKDSKFGIYDIMGEVIIEAKYDFIKIIDGGYFAIVSEGCKAVKDGEHTVNQGGKWGLIDTCTGKIVVPIKYKDIDDYFENGKIKAYTKDNKAVYYNKTGKKIK